MSLSGRFYVVDPTTGRKFCIEPIHDRAQKRDDTVFTNGGIDGTSTKNDTLGGSVKNSESIITKENGFTDITTLPPGHSPLGYIEYLCKTGKKVGE